ncbi:MAG: HAD family hydrolase [Armatimonadetes bacterium]|nr:HAD family hydrolase [Armatimonadota bacterium]
MPISNCTVRIRAVLFDIDGTLVDSVAMIIPGLQDAFERFTGTRPTDQFVRSLIGRPLDEQMNMMGLDACENTTLAERCDFARARFVEHKDRVTSFCPAVHAVLSLAERGWGVGLVTSKCRQEIEIFWSQFPSLKDLVTVCAGDTDRGKPAPDPAVEACRQLGVSPAETMFVGDSIFDMQCAKAAGCVPVAVTYGAGEKDALAAESPTYLFETPEDLQEWFENEFSTHHG